MGTVASASPAFHTKQQQRSKQMNKTLTIKISKWFGVHIERMKGSDDKWYLSFVWWMPRNSHQLRHVYTSIRSI